MARAEPPLDRLERRLGYSFRDRSLLALAVTHASYAHEMGRRTGQKMPDNERLEFLGDAVVNLVAAELLMELMPDADEGRLSRFRARLVSERPLAEAARDLGLGAWLRLGRGESKTGGRDKPSVLADAIEAVAGAVFLDGGLDAARRVLRRLLDPRARRIAQGREAEVDPKTRLQEHLQAQGLPLPHYRVVGREGPEHQAVFHVELRLADGRVFLGKGASKREAEQQAAAACLEAERGLAEGIEHEG